MILYFLWLRLCFSIPFKVILYFLWLRLCFSIPFKVILYFLWLRLWCSKDSTHFIVWTWFIVQMIDNSECSRDTKRYCIGLTMPVKYMPSKLGVGMSNGKNVVTFLLWISYWRIYGSKMCLISNERVNFLVNWLNWRGEWPIYKNKHTNKKELTNTNKWKRMQQLTILLPFKIIYSIYTNISVPVAKNSPI